MSINPQTASDLMRNLSTDERNRLIREHTGRILDARGRFAAKRMRVVEDQGGD